VPAHPAAQALLRAAGIPLAAPSANRSGSPSPTLASHALDDLNGEIAAVLDAGPCAIGVESTVLDLTRETPLLLRPGGVSVEQLEAVLGQKIELSPALVSALPAGEATPSPGMKYRHYAPKAELTLVRGELQAFIELAKHEQPDGVLLFDSDAIPDSWGVLRYGDTPEEQAKHLFTRLREIDALGWESVLVRAPSKEGLGLAVYNRLFRAASFREILL